MTCLNVYVQTLRSLLEKSSDADLLREMIGFTAERLMALEVHGQTGADCPTQCNRGWCFALALDGERRAATPDQVRGLDAVTLPGKQQTGAILPERAWRSSLPRHPAKSST